MPSDIFIKTATSWTAGKAKSIFIKTASSTWSAAKSVWLFFDAGWTRVWPLSGVYATTNPFISTTSSSTELGEATVLRVGTTYRGNRGTWNPNGYAISSYQYKWVGYSYQDPGDLTTNYDPSMTTLSGTTNDFTITGANYDRSWITFFVTAKASGGTPYDGSAESFRYYVVRQRPRLVVNTTPSFNITSPKIGNTISYSSSWDTTDAYKPEAARTTIFWYKNSTATTTGGTLVQTGGYSYVVQSTDLGSYIYVIETSFNSGSDYDLGSTVGISATAITSSAVTAAIAAPTISSITASSIGGAVSVSFTGGSGPFYQIFWWGTATAPTGTTNADASGSASPLTDNTGPSSIATQYMYIRSVTTQSDTGVANATTISPWSDGVQFNMTSASALTPTFGTNTSTENGFTGSVTNYDSAYNWNTPSTLSFTLTNGTWTWGTASGATRPFTVTGLSASQSSTATVTTTRADYASGSNSTTGTASALPQYTVTWGANGGTGGGSTGPFNSGVAHTAPSPGTREGFTFANYRYPASGGTDPVFVLSGGSYTPTGNTIFGAQWTANAVIPTITMGSNTGITSSAGTINWTSTNQSSFSSTGTFSGTGTTGTSISKTGLTPSTTYTGTVTVTSSTGNTASDSYSLTTTAAPLIAVAWGTMTAPIFARSGGNLGSTSTSYRWGWNNQLPSSGDYTSTDITWEWQHSTSNATTTQSASPTGLLASGTRPNRTAGGLTVGGSTYNNRVSSLSGDYNATTNIASSTEPVAFSTSSRYLRYRAVVVGTNGTTYRSNYSAWV